MYDITGPVLLLLLLGPVIIDIIRGKVVWDPDRKMFVEKSPPERPGERQKKPAYYYYSISWKELQDGENKGA